MIIKAQCPKCNWIGVAKVGRRFGLTIEDYECPNCGNIVKRPYRGTYIWKKDLTNDMAKLREV